MWVTVLALAEATSGDSILQYVLPAALALAATVIVGGLALSGTFRTAATNHETEFDKLVHARLNALDSKVAELTHLLEAMTGERDRYRETNARLRLEVLAAGLDPDNMRRDGGDGSSR
ncbi:MAG TPA: hypothetical protein VK453_25445 [Micromonosporaceae bacterium]|nr:hypothetical protein [Micromonosporaceae bacterium]